MAVKVRNGKKERVIEEPVKKEETVSQDEKFTPLVLKAYDDSHINSISDHNIYEVNINDIKEKENNNFIKGNIEKLADSIKKIGLSQPIIIKSVGRNDELVEQFEVVAGHRRLEAYKYLYKNYGDDYLKIQAYILNKEEESKEQEIYLETNSHSRNITLYEAILNCDLKEINFDNPEFKEKYIKIVGENKKDKFDNNSIVKYLTVLIKENFPNLEDTKEDTVRRYYLLIRNSCDELTEAVLKGTISVKDAKELAKLSKENQRQKLLNLEFGIQIPKIEEDEKEDEDKLKDKNSYNQMLKISNRLKSFVTINLDKLDTNNFTANSKAYLKQMNKVIEEIKKLDKMPKK